MNGTEHPYKFGGKEHNQELGLDWYDFGARMYDPSIGRWHVADNLSELYFSNSTYVYALNTPLQAIDPDGNIVIFINGQHTGSGGKAEYWRSYQKVLVTDRQATQWGDLGEYHYETREVSAFDRAVMRQLGDYNAMYRDGSDGGFANTLTRPRIGNTKNNLSASNRRNAGFKQGEKDAASIIANLERSKTSGEIIETIKIITHSMGGAYGKGYVKALKKYIKTLPVEQQRQIKITLVADFDPFNGSKMKADKNIKTQQFTHLGYLAEQRQEGLSDEDYYETEGSHSILSFFNNISDLQEGTYEWNGSEWTCTSCKKD